MLGFGSFVDPLEKEMGAELSRLFRPMCICLQSFVDRVRASVSNDIRQLGHDRFDMIDRKHQKNRTKLFQPVPEDSEHNLKRDRDRDIEQMAPTAGEVSQAVTSPGANLPGPADAGDVWEIMGMEHDVTGKILAAGSGPGGVGSRSCWLPGEGRVTVGDLVEVTPRAAGILPFATMSGAGHMGVGFERVESAQDGKPCGRSSAGISAPTSDACYLQFSTRRPV